MKSAPLLPLSRECPWPVQGVGEHRAWVQHVTPRAAGCSLAPPKLTALRSDSGRSLARNCMVGERPCTRAPPPPGAPRSRTARTCRFGKYKSDNGFDERNQFYQQIYDLIKQARVCFRVGPSMAVVCWHPSHPIMPSMVSTLAHLVGCAIRWSLGGCTVLPVLCRGAEGTLGGGRRRVWPFW